MGKLKKYWLVIIVILTILGGLFYWFQWKPSQIVKQCNEESVDKAKDINDGSQAIKVYDARYKSCLRSKGLTK